MWLKHYKYYPGDIQRLKLFSIFGKSIQIIHTREDCPKFMSFCSFSNDIDFWKGMFNQAGFELAEK